MEEYLKQKFPDLKTSLYLNRRNKFVHMGIDFPLFSIENFQEIVLEIESFKKKKLDKLFRFIFPKLIHMTHWKHDYIIFERKNM